MTPPGRNGTPRPLDHPAGLTAHPVDPTPLARALPPHPRLRRLASRAATLLAAAALILTGSAGPAHAADTDVMSPDVNTSTMQARIQQEVLAEVNSRRAQQQTCGDETFAAAAPLRLDAALTSAALTHSRNMATLDFFDHTGKDGKDLRRRVEDAGYVGWQRLAENIAAGQRTARSVVDAWMKSAGHCRNIMNPDVVDLGVAVYYRVGATYRAYWTQDFGKRFADSLPAGTPQPPAFTPKTPKIAGAAKVGGTLTASPGDWGQNVTLKLQWQRDGKKISGATRSQYTLTAKDRGKRITVKATGSKPGFATTSKTSAKTGKIGYGTLTPATPQLSGAAKVGKKLKAVAGGWKPSGVKLKYQWLANGKKLKKATKTTLTLTKSLKGKTITVKVTGSKSGYKTVSKTSPKSAKVG